MNMLALFPRTPRANPNVMDTKMKPLNLAGRPVRWLLAASFALATLAPAAAKTLTPGELADLSVIPPEMMGGLAAPLEHATPVPGDDDIKVFFEKTGHQQDCDYVTYTLRYGISGPAAVLSNPAFATFLNSFRMDFSDQLPAGLSIVGVSVDGDGSDGAGGAMPASQIFTGVNPNDSVSIENFRLSATDLDASGELDSRYVTIKITARIDQAAFPAATMVDNQALVKVTHGGGAAIEVHSHNPALPDDGDFRTGEKTSVLIDVTGCNPPPPPPGGDQPQEACFKIEQGEVDCVPGGGAFIYSMPFGAELGGKQVQLKTTTPGITIAPAAQDVPVGGGVLAWTITGAAPGDVVHLIVVGVDIAAGPADGVGLCCTQTIDLVIPADIDCPDLPKQPDLKVEKVADVATCTKEGGCDFTITVTNVGDAPYNGKIVLDEVTTPGSAAVSSGPNAPWTCLPMASPMSCEHPATTLNPGESKVLKLGFTPGPAWDANFIRNCAEYDYTASGFAAPFGDTTNDKACAAIPLCIPGVHAECTPPEDKPKVDLTIRKIATPVECTADGVCHWQIVILNPTTETFNGPLTVTDTFTTHTPASANFEPTGPWVCAAESGTTFRCDHPGLVLVGGASTVITVEAVIGESPNRDVENCGDIVPFPDEADTTNNHSCAVARLPEPEGEPKLEIAKTCDAAVAGAAISCRITVTNVGTAAPSGSVRVNDAAELVGAGTPVSIQAVSPDGPEWSCGAVPSDALACEIPGAVMTPGTSRYFDATVNVSPNERFENCARGSFGPAPGDDVVRGFGEACAQGGATIHVEKTGDAQCVPGAECHFEITITNSGVTAFSGQVRIGDAMQVEGTGKLEGVQIVSVQPPFGCADGEPATLPMSCLADLSLGAGESRTHSVTVVMPNDGKLTEGGRGENCVAVLSPEAPVAAGGQARATGIGGERPELGQAYACHPFDLIQTSGKPLTKECSAGFELNAEGKCVCPEGTSFRNGKCAGEPTKLPLPRPKTKSDPKPEQCTLLKGQIRDADGDCICPRGTELKNGACRKVVVEQPPVRQCKLLPGQIRTAEGKCVCRKGTTLKNGECRKVEVKQPPVRQCTLLPGQIRTNDGRCVCPSRTTLKNGKCVKNVTAKEPPARLKPDLRLIPKVINPELLLPRRDPNAGKKTEPAARTIAPRTTTPKVNPQLAPKAQILKVRPGTLKQ